MKTDNTVIAACVVSGVGGMGIKDKNTSCEQKVKDGSPNINVSRSNNADDNINVVSAGLNGMKLSNDVDGEDISDDKLFADPPPKEDCPICMLPMPYCGLRGGTTYEPCCGKTLCEACVMAFAGEMVKGNMNDLCAFCRMPMSKSNEEDLKRVKKRMKVNDSEAFCTLGWWHYRGQMGLTKDINKALEFWKQAAKLGSLSSNHSMGVSFHKGQGVERDMKKAIHHWKVAAIGGHEIARFSLGIEEMNEGHYRRAMKHWMISASAGYDKALKHVGQGYKDGLVTKDEYANTLRAQVSVDEMKSKQREMFGGVVKEIP